ncbi:MAG: carbohydrate ABC transporter permease [Chloroflexota bacterium]|nr:carbohydrate ABC transporter permease [Chloroflexota bacterium]
MATRAPHGSVESIRRRQQVGNVLHLIVVVLACVAAIFPFYWMIKSSLTTQSAFTWPPEMIPTSISFEPYVNVINNYPVVRWFLNSSFVAVVTTFFAVMIALNAGLALSRYRTRLTGTFGAAILITQMLPATLLVIPMFIIFRNVKLIDSLWGLVIANLAFALPLAIWVLKGFFDGIPREIEEASMIDGSSEVGAFYRVTIPLALPGIIAVSIYAFMVSWGEFFFARTLINQETNWVFTVGLSSFRGEHTLQWSELLAAATIFTIPPLLFFAGLQRHLIAGMTGGAVKG